MLNSCWHRETFSPASIAKDSAALDLNSASQKDLEKLTGVGEDLARRIIEYRLQHNGFRRPEELLLLRGMSEEKFRAI